jgi:hypothetical protein
MFACKVRPAANPVWKLNAGYQLVRAHNRFGKSPYLASHATNEGRKGSAICLDLPFFQTDCKNYREVLNARRMFFDQVHDFWQTFL